MFNGQDPMIKVLDKEHKLLKYMFGTKGRTEMGQQYLLTCTCKAYMVTVDEAKADWFLEDHKDCDDF